MDKLSNYGAMLWHLVEIYWQYSEVVEDTFFQKNLQTDLLAVSHIHVTSEFNSLINEIRSASKYWTTMKVIICNVWLSFKNSETKAKHPKQNVK